MGGFLFVTVLIRVEIIILEVVMEYKCPNCGAAVQSEVCPYCGSHVDIDSQQMPFEYPIIKCKEGYLSFFNTVFPLIFAVAFGLASVLILCLTTSGYQTFPISTAMFSIPFLLISIVAWAIVIRRLYIHLMLKTKGEEYQAIVYGYVLDDFTVNNVPAQMVKLLLYTKEGPKFLLYRTGKTYKPYAVNSRIPLIIYRNYVKIDEDVLSQQPPIES